MEKNSHYQNRISRLPFLEGTIFFVMEKNHSNFSRVHTIYMICSQCQDSISWYNTLLAPILDMTNSYVWYGIIAGVFVAGLGMGYVAFQQSTHTNYMMLNQQQMQYMMNDPQQMAMWQQTMMDNPEAMNQWMDNPQHVKQMTNLMRSNHDFIQRMMMEMINDPSIRLQMLGHMSENQEAMQQMRQIVQGQMIQNQTMGNMTMMDDGMMNHP